MIDEKNLHEDIAEHFKREIDNGHHELDPVDTCAAVRRIIDNQPKFDAPDINAGTWTRRIREVPWGVKGDHVCSACNESCWLPYNYCPNCGAKMEKGTGIIDEVIRNDDRL